MSLDVLAFLFVSAVLSGCVDAISGGGGLIGIPALMLAGLNPVQALATNKLQAVFGKLSAVYYFRRQGLLRVGEHGKGMLMSFVGSGLGALTVQLLPNTLLSQLLPILVAAAALYVLFSPRLMDEPGDGHVSIAFYSYLIVPILSFYDGFFGPASGAFFLLSSIGLLKLSVVQASAYTKLLLLVSNLTALMFFIPGGHIVWTLGGVMALGQWLGGWIGARMVHHKGSKIVKPMLVIICVSMLIKIGWERF